MLFLCYCKYWFNNSPFVLFRWKGWKYKQTYSHTLTHSHTNSIYLFYEEIICKKCEKIKFWWTCLWRKFLCFIMLIFADWFWFMDHSFFLLFCYSSFRINIWHTTQYIYFSFSNTHSVFFRHSFAVPMSNNKNKKNTT